MQRQHVWESTEAGPAARLLQPGPHAHISSRAMPPLPTTATRAACRSCLPSRCTLSVSRIVSTRRCSAASSSPCAASAPDAERNTTGGSCLGRAPAQMHSLSKGRRRPLPRSRACDRGVQGGQQGEQGGASGSWAARTQKQARPCTTATDSHQGRRAGRQRFLPARSLTQEATTAHLGLEVHPRRQLLHVRQVGPGQLVQGALHQGELLQGAAEARHHAHALRPSTGGESGTAAAES